MRSYFVLSTLYQKAFIISSELRLWRKLKSCMTLELRRHSRPTWRLNSTEKNVTHVTVLNKRCGTSTIPSYSIHKELRLWMLKLCILEISKQSKVDNFKTIILPSYTILTSNLFLLFALKYRYNPTKNRRRWAKWKRIDFEGERETNNNSHRWMGPALVEAKRWKRQALAHPSTFAI
jgi:hypothetical protein